jgi:hypothetical protein
MSQSVTINPGVALISFWTEFPVCNTTGFVQLRIDADVIWSTTEADAACNLIGYTLRQFDVSTKADGGVHDVIFESIANAGAGPLNFFIDDVEFNVDVLPVELTSFTARMTNDGALLRWTTASEEGNAGFEIEQSLEDAEFENVGFVEGRGTTLEPQVYEYALTGLEPGHYAFRLKQIDFDGAFEYSPVIEATVVVPDEIWLAPAYPNPFNPVTVMRFAVPTEQHVKVQMHDVSGRVVRTLYDGVASVSTPIAVRIDAEGLTSGVYLIRAEGATAVATRTVTVLK